MKRLLSVLGIVVLLGVVRAATALCFAPQPGAWIAATGGMNTSSE